MRSNIALQGGGSHGAFAWGVLDRLLEEPDLVVPAIVGTSAGAINAVLLAAGLAGGGPAGAKDLLRAFWTRLSEPPPGFPAWAASGLPGWPDWRGFGWMVAETWARVLSPYQFNPLDFNPLRDLLRGLVDFSVLRAGEPKLFLCATNVMTGKLRIFDHSEIEVAHMLASACLPTLFQAVRIGDEMFWDGGFMGNPPIFPVIYNTDCTDVMIVQINPIGIDRLPTSPQEISDRIATLSFNSSLQRELRAIHFISRLVEDGALDAARFKRLNVHVVEAEDVMRGLSVRSKFDTSPAMIQGLHSLGRARMESWLAAHRDTVGRRSSVDLSAAHI
ncbi:MAG: patatin-like phospholipase family protein [Alsobacter sp.]